MNSYRFVPARDRPVLSLAPLCTRMVAAYRDRAGTVHLFTDAYDPRRETRFRQPPRFMGSGAPLLHDHRFRELAGSRFRPHPGALAGGRGALRRGLRRGCQPGSRGGRRQGVAVLRRQGAGEPGRAVRAHHQPGGSSRPHPPGRSARGRKRGSGGAVREEGAGDRLRRQVAFDPARRPERRGDRRGGAAVLQGDRPGADPRQPRLRRRPHIRRPAGGPLPHSPRADTAHRSRGGVAPGCSAPAASGRCSRCSTAFPATPGLAATGTSAGGTRCAGSW